MVMSRSALRVPAWIAEEVETKPLYFTAESWSVLEALSDTKEFDFLDSLEDAVSFIHQVPECLLHDIGCNEGWDTGPCPRYSRPSSGARLRTSHSRPNPLGPDSDCWRSAVCLDGNAFQLLRANTDQSQTCDLHLSLGCNAFGVCNFRRCYSYSGNTQ